MMLRVHATTHFLLLWILRTQMIGADDSCAGVFHNGYCLYYNSDNLTWTDAQSACQLDQDGHLVHVEDSDMQAAMVGLLTPESMPAGGAWIGAREEQDNDTLWRLQESAGGVVTVLAQGCHSEYFTATHIANNTPLVCLDECAASTGTLYASVQNGSDCNCANSLPANLSNMCDVPCAGNSTLLCGGTASSYVYFLAGGYVRWNTEEPRFVAGENRECAVIQPKKSSASGASHGLAARMCDDNYYFLCQIDTYDYCNETNYVETNGICYYHGTSKLSWYTAAAECNDREGHLIRVTSAAQHQDVVDLMNNMLDSQYNNKNHWLAVSKRFFEWIDPEDEDNNEVAIFSSFGAKAVSSSYFGCASMLGSSDSFDWAEAVCTDTKPYVCQRDVDCGTAPPLVAATLQPIMGSSVYGQGGEAKYTCMNDSYWFAGQQSNTYTASCQQNGTWNVTQNCSAVSVCDSPAPPLLPGATVSYPSQLYATEATYMCNDANYWFLPSKLLILQSVCQATAEWHPIHNDSCHPIECGNPPPVSHATVALAVSGDTVYPAQATYTCDSGHAFPGQATTKAVSCQKTNGQWEIVGSSCHLITTTSTTTPVSTSTTTIVSTSTSNVSASNMMTGSDNASTSTPAGATPASGASTGGGSSDLDTISIVMIVAILLCIIIIIILIILVIYLKKTRDASRVSPESVYDARDEAPLANGHTLTAAGSLSASSTEC